MNPSFRKLVQRLRSRKVVQWSVAYSAVGWALLQFLDFLGQTFGWSPTVLRVATVGIGLGLALTVVLAWYHGERGAQRVSGPELLMVTALFLIAGSAMVLVGTSQGDTGPESGSTADVAPRERSIAVLPFVNMSPSEEDEYFSDGLTEELLNALTRLDGLQVAARTSSFAFKGRDVPVQRIGEELGVAHVLEGSVRKAEDGRLRITAQLIDARDGFHLWSETYDRTLDDIFAIQEEISRSIVRALEVEVTGTEDEVHLLARAGTEDYEAYDLYLRGLRELGRSTRASIPRSIELFEAAIRRDPSFARAHAGLADALVRMGIFYRSPSETFPAAIRSAERAIELDPGVEDGYVSLAFIKTEYTWEWEEAERLFRRSLELNDGSATAHQWYQNVLRDLGRCEEAIDHGERSVRLDPLAPVIVHDLAYTYYYCRRFELAEESFREAVALDDGLVIGHMRLGMTLAELGRFREALASARRAVVLSDSSSTMLGAYARVLADAGREDEARTVLALLEERAEDEYVDGVYFSAAYTALGAHERALELLERAYREHSPSLVSIRVHPWHDPLRNRPRFRKIQRDMGLEGPPPEPPT